MLHTNSNSYNFISTGQVIDTNDPQQRGRIRVYCMALGDMPGSNVEDIPWCQTSTPFGGTISSTTFSRSVDESITSNGPVSYGMWMIPKVGATVMVTCLNGNPMMRVSLGCLHLTGLAHSMPHGRFLVDPTIKDDPGNDGPYTSTEHPIEPMYTNSRTAFPPVIDNSKSAYSYEWKTRIVDRTVSQIQPGAVKSGDVISGVADPPNTGYQKSRLAPNLTYPSSTKTNYDSQVYSWVSPGFHSITMDDSVDNGRMRLRTASGHQILLDDTNERVYIMTARGANWIELDQDGSIDMYSSQKVSIHSVSDINLTSDNQVRILGNKGVHISTPAGEVRITSSLDTHILSDSTLRLESASNTQISAGANFNCLAGGNSAVSAGGTLNLLAMGSAQLTAAGNLNLLAGGDLVESGSAIRLNNASADVATAATAANAQNANVTSRIPNHEPWARVDSASDTSITPKYSYSDPKVGRDNTTRNKYWRR